MRKTVLLIGLVVIVSFNVLVSLPDNLESETEKEDALEVKADSYITETEKIFKETEGNPKERRERLSGFTTKVRKILSTPFTKALTKVTLINMEVTCSAMPDLESAGFATFPQSYILLEVLGKNNVDTGQMIKALSNKGTDWKFRWLLADMFGPDFQIKEAKDAMMEVILDKHDNKYVREEFILSIPSVGDTFQGKPIGEYILKIFKEEKELRYHAAYALGYLKYKPAIGVLLESAQHDTSNQLAMIRGLGYIGDKEALPGMFALLKDKNVRAHVAAQLGKIGEEVVIDTLINILENDEDGFVRYCAAHGLALTDNDRAYEVLIKHGAVSALSEAVEHGQLKALDALKEIGTPRALKKLKWLSTEGSITTAKIKERAKQLLKEEEDEK